MFKAALISLIVSCFFANLSKAQSVVDTIELKKGAYYYQNRKLDYQQFKTLTKNNVLASAELKKAKANAIPAVLFSGIGGGLIGFPLGGLLAGNKMDSNAWTVVGIGAGLVGVGITFNIIATKHSKAAIKAYNQNPQSATLHLKLGLSNYCARLQLQW